jgi:hypothetical protein
VYTGTLIPPPPSFPNLFDKKFAPVVIFWRAFGAFGSGTLVPTLSTLMIPLPPPPKKKIAPVAATVWVVVVGGEAAPLCRLQVLKIWNITLSTVKLWTAVVKKTNLPVLRIRIRDKVPFWPLDPGSGMGLFRIPGPYFEEGQTKERNKKCMGGLARFLLRKILSF